MQGVVIAVAVAAVTGNVIQDIKYVICYICISLPDPTMAYISFLNYGPSRYL